MAKQKGMTALVTGSTDGVGRLVARRLAEGGMHVIVHGRDHVRGGSLVAEIAAAGGNAEFLAADLANLSEVHRLADAVLRKAPRLQLLLNNAGIGSGGPGDRRRTNTEGYELRFMVNYLAGFLLSHLLLRRIKESAPARIVNVASAGQQALDFSDLMLERGYSGSRAYCQSKLAQIMFTIDLAEELRGSGVTVNALHPATYMDTTMVRQAGVTPVSSVEEGAEAILNLALSPALDGRSGLYFSGQRETRANAQAYHAGARRRLGAMSRKLVGLATEDAPPER